MNPEHESHCYRTKDVEKKQNIHNILINNIKNVQTTTYEQSKLVEAIYSEKDKWINFWGIKDLVFIDTIERDIQSDKWVEYDINSTFYKLYIDLIYYDFEENYAIDIYSSNTFIEQLSNNMFEITFDVDKRIFLVDVINSKVLDLMFLGSIVFAEEVLWLNENIFIILGHENYDNKCVPLIWKVDMKKYTIKTMYVYGNFKCPHEKYFFIKYPFLRNQ